MSVFHWGRARYLGVVWGEGRGDVAPAKKMKPVAGRFDAPPMPEAHRRFIDWVAAYTLSPPGTVMRMSLTAPKALEPPRATIAFGRAGTLPDPKLPDLMHDRRRAGACWRCWRSAASERRCRACRGGGLRRCRWCAGWPMPGRSKPSCCRPRYPASVFEQLNDGA